MIIKGLGDVASLAPSHYTTEYPKLMEFMEMYFRVSHKQGVDYSHEYFLKQLQLVREREGNSTKVMDVAVDAWYDSLGMDLKANTSTAFDDVRFIKLLHHLYQIRGTMKCAEIFFSIFFGNNVEVRQSFPRDRMAVLDDNFILDGDIVTRDDDLYSEFSYEVELYGVGIADTSGNARGSGNPRLDFMVDVDPKYGDVANTFEEAEARRHEGYVKNNDGRDGTLYWTGWGGGWTMTEVDGVFQTDGGNGWAGIGSNEVQAPISGNYLVEFTIHHASHELFFGNSPARAPFSTGGVRVNDVTDDPVRISRTVHIDVGTTVDFLTTRAVGTRIAISDFRVVPSTEMDEPTANKETFDSVHALYMKTLHPSGFKAHITRT